MNGVAAKRVQFGAEEQIRHHRDNSFNTSNGASTPAVNKLRFKAVEERADVDVAPQGSLVKPNYEDILKRVSVVIHQHIAKCENRFANATPETYETGQFHRSQMLKFSEENFVSPQYAYQFIRAPLLLSGFLYGIRKLHKSYNPPKLNEVHDFLVSLFVGAQLTAECSIVCLIYVERLMETANVGLSACNWKPCLLCGLLLASKVWQDIGSWNSEIATICPQYSVQSINRLERTFCEEIKWDLYISSSAYAKYYFALRALTEKKDFRRHYVTMLEGHASMGVTAPGAKEISIRTEGMKQHVLATILSKSL